MVFKSKKPGIEQSIPGFRLPVTCPPKSIF
nr:MAG TPA: hypothetical protein [Caudoviricetes sp.]